MGLGMVFKDTPLLKLFNNQKYLLMSDDQQITKKDPKLHKRDPSKYPYAASSNPYLYNP